MTTRDDLIRRLCEASEGSAELSCEYWAWITGSPHEVFHGEVLNRDRGLIVPCLTTSLSAAWEEAEMRDFDVDVETFRNNDGVSRRYSLKLWRGGNYYNQPAHVSGTCLPCLVCAAILAAEGER